MVIPKKEFINRETEIQSISELLSVLKQGDAIRFPIREYLGVGGIGKSTLLNFVGTLCDEIPITKTNHDFQEKEITPKKLLEILLTNISINLPDSGNFSDLSIEELISKFNEVLAMFSGVIMFDSFDGLDQNLIEFVGREIIFPASESGKVLIILASRNTIDWGPAKYKIRRRTKSTILRTFTLQNTRDQLDGTLYQGISKEIQSITSGHPESNNIVVDILQHIEESEKSRISRDRFSDYEARLIGAVVDKVIRQEFIVPDDYFGPFCVLSILRRFDVDLPKDFMTKIDLTPISKDVSVTSLILKLQQDMGGLIELDSQFGGYSINEFVRRTLSLYMRFFFPDDYLYLSRVAYQYYEKRLSKSPLDVHLIREKLFHLADIVRLEQPEKFDLSIIVSLKEQLQKDAINSFGSPYGKLEHGINDPDERQRAFARLRDSLKEDEELLERIGDVDKPNYLIGVLDEIQDEILETGRAVLDIVKHTYPLSDDNGEEKSGFEVYSIAFLVAQQNIDITLQSRIPTGTKDEFLNFVRFANTIEDLEDIGKLLRSEFLPARIQDILKQHKGPLVINVNDPEIPWELIHDGDEFIALRLPLGKRLRSAETARVAQRKVKEKLRPLLVGMSHTSVPGFAPLEYVELEIEKLIEAFKTNPNLDFDPARDVMLNEQATRLNFKRALGSGRYELVHFAGHTVYDESPDKAGLVLFDRMFSLQDVKGSIALENSPLVFLNSCHSGQEETMNVNAGYVGTYTLGIASSFIVGGAMACVGSTWKVLDKNGADFALGFYREALNGVNIGESIRRSKIEAKINRADEKIWASYVLYGDPSIKLILK